MFSQFKKGGGNSKVLLTIGPLLGGRLLEVLRQFNVGMGTRVS
jgi:hypothetical protein